MINVLEKIDKLRIERNWTFYKLAETAEIPHSTLLNMFSRKTLPSITTLDAICGALGISLAEFFEENERPALSENFKKLTIKEKDAVFALIDRLAKD